MVVFPKEPKWCLKLYQREHPSQTSEVVYIADYIKKN